MQAFGFDFTAERMATMISKSEQLMMLQVRMIKINIKANLQKTLAELLLLQPIIIPEC
jgi:hypothetical protein